MLEDFRDGPSEVPEMTRESNWARDPFSSVTSLTQSVLPVDIITCRAGQLPQSPCYRILTCRMYGLTLPSISLAVSTSNLEGYSKWPTSQGLGQVRHASVETGTQASCRSDTILSCGVFVNMRDFIPIIRKLMRCSRLSMASGGASTGGRGLEEESKLRASYRSLSILALSGS
jgi:hypothetical protein